jgi:ActR/RegA family two-component response regulator
MANTSSSHQDAVGLFKKKINLLIVDDDRHVIDSLADVFTSPLFTIKTVASLDEAYGAIGALPHLWHCWIVDIDLGQGASGLELLKRYPQFPFSVMLSGLRSMALAADAIKLGARGVMDKDPSQIDRFYDEVCKTAALGYVLKGKSTPHLDLFLLLQDPEVISIEQWAEKASIPLRQLQRVCETHSSLTPRLALALFRTVYYLLWHIPGEIQNGNNASSALSGLASQHRMNDSSIDYIVRKMKKRQF